MKNLETLLGDRREYMNCRSLHFSANGPIASGIALGQISFLELEAKSP
jgi:hypothetical protein